jgi:molecular chaperone GrpE
MSQDDNSPDEGVLEPDLGGPEGEAGLRAKLDAVEKEKQETYERLLRTAADFDNFRKRARKDVDDARWKAREELLRELLPVVDNLERALAAAGGDEATGPVVDGVRLVLRQFHAALERFDVKAFDAVGEPFDPARHEAISQIDSAQHAPGSVAAQMQRGYTMGGKLVRPALVAVARPPAAAKQEDSSS